MPTPAASIAAQTAARHLGFRALDLGGLSPTKITGRVLGGPGRGSASIDHPGIGFRGDARDNPVLKSFYLDIPTRTVQGRRRGQDVFDERQKPINFAIQEERLRLTRLVNAGLIPESILNDFNKFITPLTKVGNKGSNESIPFQQQQLDIIADAESIVSDALGRSGLTPEQIDAFNQESIQRSFNNARGDLIKHVTRLSSGGLESGISGDPGGIGDGDSAPLFREGNVQSRLKSFVGDFFPDFGQHPGGVDPAIQRKFDRIGVPAPSKFRSDKPRELTGDDAIRFVDDVLKKNEGKFNKIFGNVSNTREALFKGQSFGKRV
jgi:hypothetical protein